MNEPVAMEIPGTKPSGEECTPSSKEVPKVMGDGMDLEVGYQRSWTLWAGAARRDKRRCKAVGIRLGF